MATRDYFIVLHYYNMILLIRRYYQIVFVFTTRAANEYRYSFDKVIERKPTVNDRIAIINTFYEHENFIKKLREATSAAPVSAIMGKNLS